MGCDALRYSTAMVVIAAMATTLGAQPATQRDEEFARRQYESGLSFMRDAQYSEALKDFQAVVDSFPTSSVADDALLQMALYHLEVSDDPEAAQQAVDTLLKEYPDADATPMGYVLVGRLAMARGRGAAEVDSALASFERVPRLFPGTDAVPAAVFHAGDALRIARRPDEALDRFRRVAMEYPRSIWAARATLAAGVSLVQSNRAPRAFEEFQRIRQQFPGSPEAATALDYNTILYRFYVRAPHQPPYAFTGRFIGAESARFRDVVGVSIDGRGGVYLGHRNAVDVFDATGAAVRSMAANQPSSFFLDDRGRIVIARRELIVTEGGGTASITVTAANRPRAVDDIPSAVQLSTGDLIVADRRGRNVIRASPDGAYLGPFSGTNAERLARNQLDDVAIIDRDARSVVVLDRDGKALSRFPQRGTGYEFDRPVDVAFDPLGHLYVLDRGRASVFVFGPGNRLIATVTVPQREPGGFQRPNAFAIDTAGRLFVFDESVQRIRVYQ